MKLKYLAYFAGAALMLTLSSCSDFLDKVPDTRVDLQTVEQLRELLINGYTQYNYAIPCEMSTDNMIDNNSPNVDGVRYNLSSYSLTDEQAYKFEDVDMGDGSDTPSGIWEGCYHAIACANAVLERGNEMKTEGGLTSDDEARLNAVMGEAYLIRAYHHFILAQVFCMPYRGETLSADSTQYPGIPYIKAPETTVKPHYYRGSLQQTYANIKADLETGLPLINDTYYEVPKYHFNRAAAWAFAARFYLFTRDYQKCLEAANTCFNGSDPSTMMSDIWYQASSLYSGSDRARYYSSINRPNVFMDISTYSTASRRIAGYRFACNREAKRCTFQGPGPSWQNIKWRNTKTNETYAMHPCFSSLLFYRSQNEYGLFFGGTGVEQFEYTDKLAGIGYAHMVRLEFWAEETLLCRAEAKLFLGDKEGCMADLKIWDTARQNLTSSYSFLEFTPTLLESFYANDQKDSQYKDGFGIVKPIRVDEVCPSDKYQLTEDMVPYLQCIQHFRRIETVHNGMRFFDIKRLGLEITHYYGRFKEEHKLKFMDPHYAIQIPAEVIVAGLDSNPRVSATTADEASEDVSVLEK